MESSLVMMAIFALLMIGSTTCARPYPRENKKTDCITSEVLEVKHNMLNKEKQPRPNVSAYDKDHEEKSFVNDFEPRPNVSAYDNDHEDKSFVNDFEPRPNVSAYDNDDKQKSFVNDFEPAYEGDKKVNGGKDFEPRPNVSIYQG